MFGVKPPEPLDYKLHCDFVLVYIGIFGICNMSLIIIHLRIASLTPKENNPHKKKCKHNPIGDAAVEMYLSGLEEEILFLDKGERI